MAKKPTKEEMELLELREHLTRQDKLLGTQSEKLEGMFTTVKEILTILGGSVSMDVPGMRKDVKDLKVKVEALEKAESTRGKWVIPLNTIPGAVITLVMLIGSLLGIVKTIQELTKEPPKEVRPQGPETQKQPQSSATVHLPEFFPFLPSQELL